MNIIDKAVATQLANIEKRTGKTLAELLDIVKASGLAKHGQIVAMLKADLGMGHGDANLIAHRHKAAAEGEAPAAAKPAAAAAPASGGDSADAIYVGPKAALRPIHDALMAKIAKFGDFEIAPKKGYISLRRKKQFAMIGPATNTRVEVGINAKDLTPTDRLEAMPPKGMCQYKVRIGAAAEVDAELIAWIRHAYDAAG